MDYVLTGSPLGTVQQSEHPTNLHYLPNYYTIFRQGFQGKSGEMCRKQCSNESLPHKRVSKPWTPRYGVALHDPISIFARVSRGVTPLGADRTKNAL